MSAAVIAAALLGAAGVVLIDRARLRREFAKLSKMLDQAIAGTFKGETFDESALSALESKLDRFLAAGSIAHRKAAEERDAIKALIADISHQTKTPVSNILLYAQLLGEQPLTGDGVIAVEALTTQAQKLNFLIDSLVKISRLETGIIAVHPKPQALAPLLAEAAIQVGPKGAEKGLEIRFLETEAEAAFDRKWTGEALSNLLDNAVKYTPPGGTVTVSAAENELFCRVDVADTGPGIPEEEQAKIFTRFYRSPTVSDQDGVGLGLYLAREIVAAEGGYIKVASTPGRGSVFSIFLPRMNLRP